MNLSWSQPKRLRILDFDIETRPLHWYGGDLVSKEITAIAAKFIGEPGKVRCWLLGQDEPEEILEGFRTLYDQADMVTGHYIRGFDLPTINAMLMEIGAPKLSSKLTHDTCTDLLKRSGLSGSQESIADMLGIKHPKVQMGQQKWRAANRLNPESFQLTYKRAVGDVLQNIEMRARLMELGYLGPPRVWSSGGGSRYAEKRYATERT